MKIHQGAITHDIGCLAAQLPTLLFLPNLTLTLPSNACGMWMLSDYQHCAERESTLFSKVRKSLIAKCFLWTFWATICNSTKFWLNTNIVVGQLFVKSIWSHKLLTYGYYTREHIIFEDFLYWGLTKKKHFKVQRAGWARIFPWGRKIAVVDFKSRYTGMHSLL